MPIKNFFLIVVISLLTAFHAHGGWLDWFTSTRIGSWWASKTAHIAHQRFFNFKRPPLRTVLAFGGVGALTIGLYLYNRSGRKGPAKNRGDLQFGNPNLNEGDYVKLVFTKSDYKKEYIDKIGEVVWALVRGFTIRIEHEIAGEDKTYRYIFLNSLKDRFEKVEQQGNLDKRLDTVKALLGDFKYAINFCPKIKDSDDRKEYIDWVLVHINTDFEYMNKGWNSELTKQYNELRQAYSALMSDSFYS